MIIRFKLNTMEFECEFSNTAEMIEFFRNLLIHNRRRVKFIKYIVIKE